MTIANFLKKEFVKKILIILLAVQVCLIAHSNLTLLGKNLDCDTGKLFTHVMEMWKQKTPFLPNWDYLTTLEWDCSSVLALPFYGLTHNIFLSFGISNIIFLCGFLGLIFFLFRGENMLYPLFCANLLVIPFRVGMLEYYNMLFFGGSQYIIKVSVPILLVGLILSVEKQHEKNQSSTLVNILMVVYLGLHFLSSMSSGVYVFVCGVFPIIVVYIGYKFFRWEKVPYRMIVLILSTVLLTAAGWYINMKLMVPSGSFRGENSGASGNSMTFCSVHQLLSSISHCFWGMFELYGGATESFELRILSGQGISLLAKCCLVVGLLISGIVCIAKCVKQKGNLRILLLISSFFWNVFVLMISYPRGGSATYEYRYHLIGMLPLMCAAVSLLIEGIQKLRKEQQICLYAAGCLAILFLGGVSYKELYSRGEQNAALKELCTYVKDSDVEYVYLFNNINDAELCRAIDENNSYICLLEEGVTYAYDYYMDYVNGPIQTTNAIVVVRDDYYQFGDSFEIGGYMLQKFDSVANQSLYYFSE